MRSGEHGTVDRRGRVDSTDWVLLIAACIFLTSTTTCQKNKGCADEAGNGCMVPVLSGASGNASMVPVLSGADKLSFSKHAALLEMTRQTPENVAKT